MAPSLVPVASSAQRSYDVAVPAYGLIGGGLSTGVIRGGAGRPSAPPLLHLLSHGRHTHNGAGHEATGHGALRGGMAQVRNAGPPGMVGAVSGVSGRVVGSHDRECEECS